VVKILHEVGRGFSHLSWARGIFHVKIECALFPHLSCWFSSLSKLKTSGANKSESCL